MYMYATALTATLCSTIICKRKNSNLNVLVLPVKLKTIGIHCKYADRQAGARSVDPDQMSQAYQQVRKRNC